MYLVCNTHIQKETVGAAYRGQVENYFNSSLFHRLVNKNNFKQTHVYINAQLLRGKEKISQCSSTFHLLNRER